MQTDTVFIYVAHLDGVFHITKAKYQEICPKKRSAWIYTLVEFCACSHRSSHTGQEPNFPFTCVSKDCLVMRSTHVHKQRCPANLWNMLSVSAELPASVSADSLLLVSRAMKLGSSCMLYHIHTYQSPFTNQQHVPMSTSRFDPLVGLGFHPKFYVIFFGDMNLINFDQTCIYKLLSAQFIV